MTNGVPQGPATGPVLFHILINDTDKGIELTLGQFADDTRLSCPGDPREGWDVIQEDLDISRTSTWEFHDV